MVSRIGKLIACFASGAMVWNSGAVACFAHPDHSLQIVPDSSLLHYLVQPEHALPLAVFALVAWGLSRANGSLFRGVPAKEVVHVKDGRRD